MRINASALLIFLAANSVTAAEKSGPDLVKCRAADQFEYWTPPPCAFRDEEIATVQHAQGNNEAERIVNAECRLNEVKALPRDKTGTGVRRVPPTRCQR